MYKSSKARFHIIIRALLCLGLVGCQGQRIVQEAPLVASQQNVALSRFKPPEALERIEAWYPQDWRLHFLKALIDSTLQGRIENLRKADSLHPQEAVIAYQLSLAYLEQDSADQKSLARNQLDNALKWDPENGVLKVMLAHLMLLNGELPKARALFMDTRRNSGGDFYYPRIEQILLGLFSHTGHLNPYTLTEAIEIYRRIPFPPFEKWIDILYSVFLDPLPMHPYDIRIRGRDAARGLFLLGKKLRLQSYQGFKVLNSGYEQEVVGYMFQLKSAEFQTLFYQTFDDSPGAEKAYADLIQVQAEYESFQAAQPWQDSSLVAYLEGWSKLFNEYPDMPLALAIKKAEPWLLWQKARIFRYPSTDDTLP